MFTGARRYLVVMALLVLGIGLTWGPRWLSGAQRPAAVPATATDPVEGVPTAVDEQAPYIYFADVEGWYRITRYETVVRSPYDLTGDTTEAMAAALPSTVGDWQQVGPDRHVADDPAVVFYLKHPTIALERTFQDPSGQQVTLTLIGNKGDDSFLLFSHTPETCYPGRLWQVVDRRQASTPIADQRFYAQYLLTEHQETGQQLMVLYWYLWNDPERDSQDGVLSMRVNLFVPPGQSQEAVLARAWSFVELLFPSVLPWERF